MKSSPESVTLALGHLPEHRLLRLTFELLLIRGPGGVGTGMKQMTDTGPDFWIGV